MNALFRNRLVRSYAVLLLGVFVFLARRQFIPTQLEAQGLPLDIAVPSVLNVCYTSLDAVSCTDPVIVVATTLATAVAMGWGSPGLILFTLILAPLPLAIYFLLGPIWLVLLALLLIPLVMEIGFRFVFGPAEPAA